VDKNYPIRVACNNGNVEVVKLLLACPRVNPAAKDNYALKVSIQNGHKEVIQLLLKSEKVDSEVYYKEAGKEVR